MSQHRDGDVVARVVGQRCIDEAARRVSSGRSSPNDFLHLWFTQYFEAIRADRSYAPPYEKNGVTVIPASTVRGGGGGGDREGDSGAGFGLTARPAGAWVIKGDQVTWKPVSHPGRVIAGAEVIIALGLARSFRRHRRRTPALGLQRRLQLHRHRRHRLHLPGR